MKKLLNTLYITSKDAYLALDGSNVVVMNGDDIVRRLPLHNFESIVTFGYTGASPALMRACAERSILLTFMTEHGRFLAQITGEEHGNVLLRKEQYRVSEDEMACAALVRNILVGKLHNSRWVIERATRDYPDRLDVPKLRKAAQSIAEIALKVRETDNADDARGLEGAAASIYFSVFDDMILTNKADFYFKGRNRRPSLDPVNAMLSFIYAMLGNDIAAAVRSVGLDAYVGFLHRDRSGRRSLSLDLLEELRAPLADRFVLTMINTRQIMPSAFLFEANGAVILTDDGRKAVLTAWQKRKSEEITHPYLKEKIEWGLVPHAQALLLARTLRGDLTEYPPFLWK